MKLNEDASYTLSLGCADMGTGCDTILSQMAADCLETEFENIVAFGVDTDVSPYDSGSLCLCHHLRDRNGSSSMPVSELRGKGSCALGAEMLRADPEEVDFDGRFVVYRQGKIEVSLCRILPIQGTCGNTQELQVTRHLFFTGFLRRLIWLEWQRWKWIKRPEA
ncbi:MAG: molybdopterin cofactor-binding domain-containing protein [Ruminococcus sp.]